MRRWISFILVLTMIFPLCGGIRIPAFADGPDGSVTPAEPTGGGAPVGGALSPGDTLRSSSSADLVDFLTNAEIDAPTNEQGAYIVVPGIPYAIDLSFKETASLQFDDVSMTYNIPEGLEVTDGHEGTIQVTIEHGGQTYTIAGNAFNHWAEKRIMCTT